MNAHRLFTPGLMARLALGAALVAGCSSESASSPADASPDAADVGNDTGATDAPATDSNAPDAAPLDAYADAPAIDGSATDVVRADAPDVADASDDVPRTTETLRVAYVAPGGDGRQAVWVQRADGTMRRQLHFAGVTDDVPEQAPLVPPVQDGRVVSVHHLAWSPDGTRLAAVVSTAIDQSEVVVLDAERGGGFVASHNGQYVMPALDWSPDGRRLAYVMSTRPRATGLDLAVADLPAHRWQFATQGASLRGLSVRLRFDATGAAVTCSSLDSEEPTTPWNAHSSLRRVVVATRAATVVAAELIGRVEGVTRDGATAFLMRTRRAGTDGSRDVALLSRNVVGIDPAEATLAEGGRVAQALQGPYDGALLVEDVEPDGTTHSFRVLRPGRRDLPLTLPAEAASVAAWFPAEAPAER